MRRFSDLSAQEIFLPHTSAQMSTFTLIRTEWRFLVYGLLMSFWSSLGQTFFISLFSQEIRTSLDLSHGEFGSHYAHATTASALTLFWLGKLADSVSVPRLSLMTLGGVCLAALHFSFVSSVLTLILGFYLLRLSGQGMMYHVYSTAVTRRYTATRGRALALCGLGMPLGEAAFPVLVILALGLTDWRTIWFILPLVAFFSFAPAIPYLTRRTALQDGPGRGANILSDLPDESLSVRRGVAMKDTAFWGVIVWLMMIPGFTITGLFFHQIFIAGEKGVPLWLWSSNYIWYALSALAGAFLSGFLIDRLGAHRVAWLTQLPMLFACLLLWWGQGLFWLPAFFILFGMGGGMIPPLVNALLAERYGTGWLGEIKALAMPMNVFASALSPAVMGLLIDMQVALGVIMLMLAGLSLFSVLAPLVWFNMLGLTR
ncbi:MAG: MFS transporter, partial [Pseudomonadota bacterium]|nr:MFS transporter [Pseudomonadota bacterium]